jgi:hypothetical protein
MRQRNIPLRQIRLRQFAPHIVAQTLERRPFRLQPALQRALVQAKRARKIGLCAIAHAHQARDDRPRARRQRIARRKRYAFQEVLGDLLQARVAAGKRSIEQRTCAHDA